MFDCVAKFLKHLTVNRKITGSSFTSKIVNWEPGLRWGRTRPLAVPNSAEVQVGLRVVTPQWRGIVSAPSSAWPSFRSLSSARPSVP